MQSKAAGRARALHSVLLSHISYVHHSPIIRSFIPQSLCAPTFLLYQAPGIPPVPPTDLVHALRSLESKEGGRA